MILGVDKRVSDNCVKCLSGHLLCNKDCDQSRMATGGGGVQRRPQLVVLRVDIGTSVQ